jgi:FMN phosphatase YigB (HAD superfamily)
MPANAHKNHVVWDLGNTLIQFIPHGKTDKETLILDFISCFYGNKTDYTPTEALALDITHRTGKQHAPKDFLMLMPDGSAAPGILCEWFAGTLTPEEAQKRVTAQWAIAAQNGEFKNQEEKDIIREMVQATFNPYLLAEHLWPIDHALAVLRYCAVNAENIFYILSNFDPYSFAIFYSLPRAQKLFEHFKHENICISGKARCIKPQLQIYAYFLRKYQILPTYCFFIDNQQENIRSANMCSINGIFLKDGNYEKLREELGRFKLL